VRGPFPSKEIRRISERDDPGPPVVPGGLRIGLGSRTLERAGRFWGGPATFWPLLCVAERVPQGQTESGGLILAANAGPRVPSGDVTLKRLCTYRPSVIYLIVNKLLSLSLSLSLSVVRERTCTHVFAGGGNRRSPFWTRAAHRRRKETGMDHGNTLRLML